MRLVLVLPLHKKLYLLNLSDRAGSMVKDNYDVYRTLQKTLLKFGVMISREEAKLIIEIPEPLAIRELLNMYYTGSRPVTEDFIREIYHMFLEEMIPLYEGGPSVGEKRGLSDTLTT